MFTGWDVDDEGRPVTAVAAAAVVAITRVDISTPDIFPPVCAVEF
jgi:hypothetical protein